MSDDGAHPISDIPRTHVSWSYCPNRMQESVAYKSLVTAAKEGEVLNKLLLYRGAVFILLPRSVHTQHVWLLSLGPGPGVSAGTPAFRPDVGNRTNGVHCQDSRS